MRNNQKINQQRKKNHNKIEIYLTTDTGKKLLFSCDLDLINFISSSKSNNSNCL